VGSLMRVSPRLSPWSSLPFGPAPAPRPPPLTVEASPGRGPLAGTGPQVKAGRYTNGRRAGERGPPLRGCRACRRSPGATASDFPATAYPNGPTPLPSAVTATLSPGPAALPGLRSNTLGDRPNTRQPLRRHGRLADRTGWSSAYPDGLSGRAPGTEGGRAEPRGASGVGRCAGERRSTGTMLSAPR